MCAASLRHKRRDILQDTWERGIKKKTHQLYTENIFSLFVFKHIWSEFMAKGTAVDIPPAGCCHNYKVGARRCTNTPSSSHAFLSLDRALQTGTPVWLLRETRVNDRTGWLAAVVLSLFSRCETRQHCTQGRNHFYLVNVAFELKLATLLKWAACELPLKHYFSVITSWHQCYNCER